MKIPWVDTPLAIKERQREQLEIAIIAAIMSRDVAAFDSAMEAYNEFTPPQVSIK